MGKVVGLVFRDEQTYICPHCGKTYKSAEMLAKHIEDKHSDAHTDSGS